MGYILTGNELIDGDPELGVELRRGSLYDAALKQWDAEHPTGVERLRQ